MEYNILVFSRAEKEISEAFFWYESRQKHVGRKLIKSLNDTLIRIRKNPFLFPISKFDFREGPLDGFLYIIIYRVVDDQVFFQSLFNTYQDPDKKP